MRYSNYGRNSNVSSFEIGIDNIVVQFKDGSAYLYNYSVTGYTHVEKMKYFAVKGQGLNSYIMHNARKRYARRLR